MAGNKADSHSYVWSALRIALGFIFLWGFLDKLLGLGYSTKAGKSWLDGVSPTSGFLKSASVHGPLGSFYHGLAGNGTVDWLFMIGLAAIGFCLIVGIGMRLASWAGILMLLLMWSALYPPATNPILDEHIIYILVLLALQDGRTGLNWSLARWWGSLSFVRAYPVFR